MLNIFNMKNKLNKCIVIANRNCNEIPDIFIEYLICAEDHRSKYHFGVDQIGIVRALIVWLNSNKIEGASTIEQQFVRVATKDYTRSLFRKFKEQLLAVALNGKINKQNIAKAYLSIAYYGYHCEGTRGIKDTIKRKLEYASKNQIISIIARLKYPKPHKNLIKWKKKNIRRINYINCRHQKFY